MVRPRGPMLPRAGRNPGPTPTASRPAPPADDRCANLFEALVGTLKSAKKRGIVNFPGQILLKGPHDNVEIELLKPPADGEEPPTTGGPEAVPASVGAVPSEAKPAPAPAAEPDAQAPTSTAAPAPAPAPTSGAAEPDKQLAFFEDKIFSARRARGVRRTPPAPILTRRPAPLGQTRTRNSPTSHPSRFRSSRSASASLMACVARRASRWCAPPLTAASRAQDGSGDIDLMELKRMFEKLGDPQTHVALKSIMKEARAGPASTPRPRDVRP